MFVHLVLLPLLAAAPPDPVVATVDSQPITASQLRARSEATRAAGGNADPRGLVEDLINDALLRSDARRKKLQSAPRVRAAVEAARRKLAGDLLLEEELRRVVRVDDDVLRKLFHETGDSAHLFSIVRASKQEAQATLDQLNRGAKFADAAKDSLDPRGQELGGDLGTVMRAQLEPALQEVAFTAPLGKLAGPVQLRLGWAVVKITERYVATEAEFTAKKEELRKFAHRQAQLQLQEHYVRQLRAKYAVSLDEAFLKSTGVSISPGREEAERPIARVGGKAIRYGDVLRLMEATFGAGKQGSHFSGLSVKLQMAWKLVDEAVLEQAGLDHGLGNRPEVVAAARRAEDEALVREVAQRIREGVPRPGTDELEAYYRARSAEYRRPGYRTCSHLVVASAQQAESLRKRLAAGERFEDLAVEASSDRQTRGRGGLIGDVDDGALGRIAQADGEPALAEAMRSTAPGQVSAPVKSRAGWHLVRCGAYVPPRAPPLAELSSALTARLLAEKGDAAVRARVAELRARAVIQLHPEAWAPVEPRAR